MEISFHEIYIFYNFPMNDCHFFYENSQDQWSVATVRLHEQITVGL